MQYSAEKYEFLFDQSEQVLQQQAEWILRHRDVARYRAKTIKAGDVLEVEVYPLWNTKQEASRAKRHTTRQAQKNLNDRNAKKRLIRKINANFTEDDICITLTYKGQQLPDEEQARRDIKNYLRRVKTYRKKNGMSDLKYIYVIEFGGKDGRRKRVHHHVIMSGMDRDAAERLWQKGFANTRRLQPNEYGLEALARYITKEPKGSKRWCASRNLVEPKETKSDNKISKRRAMQMAVDFDEAPHRIFAQLFPDYDFTDCSVKWSNFVAGAYIYAKMHKRKSNANEKLYTNSTRSCGAAHTVRMGSAQRRTASRTAAAVPYSKRR